MGKLSAEGLFLLAPPPPTPFLGLLPRSGQLGLLSPAQPSPLPPTLAPSQTNCKNCSWSKWSSARSWSENFKVSKVPPSLRTSPRPTSWPEPSSRAPSLIPGPGASSCPAPPRKPPSPPLLGFPTRPKTEGVGCGWGKPGPWEGAVLNSSHLINLHR